MPMKGSGSADQYRIVNEHDGGFGWIPYPDETMQRACHALVVDDEVWVVDPVDIPDLDELLAERGEVAGVVVTLDRHKRDSAAIANRHDVPVYIPTWMDGVAEELDAPVERFGDELADTGYRTLRLRDNRFWQEAGLWNPETGTLWVPESVGTVSYFCGSGERLGVHPMLRAVPPKRLLGDLDPDRILVGHGEGVELRPREALQEALSNSRKKMLGLYAKNAKSLLPV
ncbi:hypothetical protein [Haloarchaeobius amylolyticus]|uniref:hypothetical protein n=1 Tax=Haloarchaeobius amylolyticus TaxID=1198296 RepID=UPI002271F45D|nr:hypothetical protein [Haloarchaeobius amylolyticus]